MWGHMNEEQKKQYAEDCWAAAMLYGPSIWMGIDGWWLDTIDSLKAVGFSQLEAEHLADCAQVRYKEKHRKVLPPT